jgi:hypothetical protein
MLTGLELLFLKLMAPVSVPINEFLHIGPDHLLFDVLQGYLGDFAGCDRLFDAFYLLIAELVDPM